MAILADYRNKTPWYVDIEGDVHGTFFVGDVYDECTILLFESFQGHDDELSRDNCIREINEIENIVKRAISQIPVMINLLYTISEDPDVEYKTRKKITNILAKITHKH